MFLFSATNQTVNMTTNNISNIISARLHTLLEPVPVHYHVHILPDHLVMEEQAYDLCTSTF